MSWGFAVEPQRKSAQKSKPGSKNRDCGPKPVACPLLYNTEDDGGSAWNA
ncbi:hypothetical protein JYK21_26625 [Ralstonia pickettii]|nr:hypothetical protein [Ralstonia pickettii]